LFKQDPVFTFNGTLVKLRDNATTFINALDAAVQPISLQSYNKISFKSKTLRQLNGRQGRNQLIFWGGNMTVTSCT